MKNMLIAFLERCFLNCNVNHSNTQLVEIVEHLFNYKYEVVVTDDYNDDYFVLRLIEKENKEIKDIIFNTTNGVVKSIDIKYF